ncbi:unnamed protein product [Ostreobium quekettii]|uniref:Uncharacterized protein n=1 Tax=Ostreobium quekettii TaxID=121088 RepID=A0A8S1J198_9CHLO|nr:unnamed protein product [Ostreobium quekettii]
MHVNRWKTGNKVHTRYLSSCHHCPGARTVFWPAIEVLFQKKTLTHTHTLRRFATLSPASATAPRCGSGRHGDLHVLEKVHGLEGQLSPLHPNLIYGHHLRVASGQVNSRA